MAALLRLFVVQMLRKVIFRLFVSFFAFCLKLKKNVDARISQKHNCILEGVVDYIFDFWGLNVIKIELSLCFLSFEVCFCLCVSLLSVCTRGRVLPYVRHERNDI